MPAISISIVLSLLVVSSLTLAQVTPTTPGPNETYHAGTNCTIAWTTDSSGSWTNMTIDLMSGSNTNMSCVTNVAMGVDGTDSSLSPYNWTCPEVDPYSAIYFYQFTNNGNFSTAAWTTRFTIASASGETIPPAHLNQPNGDKVPWGNGQLASSVSPSPPSGTSDTAATSLFSSSQASSTAPPSFDGKDGDGEDDEGKKQDHWKGKADEQGSDQGETDDQNSNHDQNGETNEEENGQDGDETVASSQAPEISPPTDSSEKAPGSQVTNPSSSRPSSLTSLVPSATAPATADAPPILEDGEITTRVLWVSFCCPVLTLLVLLNIL